MVARLIGARQTLSNKRQVFMVSIGGFDLHDNLVSKQPGLLIEVDAALSSFFKATEELGVSEQVTTFTASDFGGHSPPTAMVQTTAGVRTIL